MKSKNNYAWLLLLVFVLTSQAIFAQIKITGSVKDGSGMAMPGTTVVQQGTQNGILTDIDGKYSIILKEEGAKSLVFSFIGYLPITVPYTGKSVIDIILQEDKVELSEVVVMGYKIG